MFQNAKNPKDVHLNYFQKMMNVLYRFFFQNKIQKTSLRVFGM